MKTPEPEKATLDQDDAPTPEEANGYSHSSGIICDISSSVFLQYYSTSSELVDKIPRKILGILSSKYGDKFEFFFKHLNISRICSTWPSYGNYWYQEKRDTQKSMSYRPISRLQWAVGTLWYPYYPIRSPIQFRKVGGSHWCTFNWFLKFHPVTCPPYWPLDSWIVCIPCHSLKICTAIYIFMISLDSNKIHKVSSMCIIVYS